MVALWLLFTWACELMNIFDISRTFLDVHLLLLFLLQIQIPASNLRKVINSRNTITQDQCAGEYTEPTSIVDLDSGGFVGVYEPDPDVIIGLLTNNTKGNFTGNITGSGFGEWMNYKLILELSCCVSEIPKDLNIFCPA